MRVTKNGSDHDDDVTAVAVSGGGFMGRGLVHRLARRPDQRPALVVNRTLDRAVDAFVQAGWRADEVVVSDDAAKLGAAVADGRPAATVASEALWDTPGIDVVVEATGALAYGAWTTLACLRAGRDVVTLNAELDALLANLLHAEAAAGGAVYTIADGDQPGVLMRLLEHVEDLGFEVVAALNCKRNLDEHQNPDDSRPYAERDGTSVLMTTAFGDGTKMQIENAVVANLTGLVPDRRGMHGVSTELATAARDVVAPLQRTGVVDFTRGGDFGGGVAVVARSTDQAMDAPYMRYAKMGDGPDYLFFRPYHLLHFEVPRTIRQVRDTRVGLGRPLSPRVAEVVAVAKEPLAAGRELDGIGGFAAYGHVAVAQEAASLLPIGLSQHARTTAAVGVDEPIPLDAVELDEDALLVALHARQAASLA